MTSGRRREEAEDEEEEEGAEASPEKEPEARRLLGCCCCGSAFAVVVVASSLSASASGAAALPVGRPLMRPERRLESISSGRCRRLFRKWFFLLRVMKGKHKFRRKRKEEEKKKKKKKLSPSHSFFLRGPKQRLSCSPLPPRERASRRRHPHPCSLCAICCE